MPLMSMACKVSDALVWWRPPLHRLRGPALQSCTLARVTGRARTGVFEGADQKVTRQKPEDRIYGGGDEDEARLVLVRSSSQN